MYNNIHIHKTMIMENGDVRKYERCRNALFDGLKPQKEEEGGGPGPCCCLRGSPVERPV